MPDVTERMNYFDRQFLRADDFRDEQAYHLDRRRGHNAGFHSAGVVDGLLVSAGGQANTVTVGRGWAVDARGREIVLATPRADVPTGGVDVDIWIAYPDPEPLSTPVVEAGTSGSTRVREEPVVTVVPPGTVPANGLRLARLSGGAIDNTVRTQAGLKNGAVTEANLADNAVSSRVLAEAEAGTSQDANSGTGVKTAHLKDRAVTEPKLADNAVSTRVVVNGAVSESKLANDAVSNRTILAGAVNEPELANNAVSAAKLRSDTANDANRAVGADHIQSKAVVSRTIATADAGNDQDVNTGAGIKTDHLKDEAVTAAKLADSSVSTAKIQDGSISTPKLQANAVARTNIQDGAVNIAKLAFRQVATNSATIGPNGVVTQPVQANAPDTKTTVFFPTLAVTNATGSGIAEVDAAIVYRRAVGSNTIDVFIRLTNRGTATAGVIWQVTTFAPATP